MAELNLTNATIVTRQEEDSIDVDAGLVEVVPAWRFLLDFEAKQNQISASHTIDALH